MRKRTKFALLRTSILLIFAILAGRVWYVQVVQGKYYKQQADTSKIRVIPVQAPRGIIYDSQGRQLVYNTPSWSVQIVPHGIPYRHASAIYHQLSRLLHGNPSAKAIASIVRSYSWRPYGPAPIKLGISSDTAMIIKQLHYALPGVQVQPSSIRQYVQDAQYSLTHILGYAGDIVPSVLSTYEKTYPAMHVDPTDQAGKTGVELSLDPYLHGINGRQRVEVDAGERPIHVIQPAHTIAGDSVTLTLNWKLQQQVSRDLATGLQHLGLQKGVAILENVRNGQILSMVSLPSYNNNLFSGRIPLKTYNALLHAPGLPLNDLATQGQFPPGSTYKLITATAALQTGVTNASRTIDDTGQIKPCPSCSVFHGWKPGGLGNMNIVLALAESSDIYFYTVAGGNPTIDPRMPKIGGKRLAYWAHQYGLGSPTGIELPYESPGFIPTPYWFNHYQPDHIIKNPGDTWSIGYNYNSAVGQGFDLTTPLQMVNVTSTIANGGTLYQPRIVKKISGRVVPRRGVLAKPKVIQPFIPTVIRSNFIDPANLQLIQQGMHQSVTPLPLGTSWNVVDKRINAAGKTGTAEDNPRPADAWWVGYAPYQNPQVAVVVMVPNAGGEGAYVAAPIAHKVLEDYFHLPTLRGSWLDNTQFCTCLAYGGTQ